MQDAVDDYRRTISAMSRFAIKNFKDVRSATPAWIDELEK